MSGRDDEIQAAREIVTLVFEKIADERGVHAETAVSAAGRMAGTFLLRSCSLPVATLTPGAPVLSDAVNAKGPVLVELFQLVLQELGVAPGANPTANATPAAPLFTVPEVQARLDDGVGAIAARHGLDDERTARAGAIATAMIVKQTAGVLDAGAAFGIATLGFVEGAKTVPPPRPTAPSPKKPWYKLW